MAYSDRFYVIRHDIEGKRGHALVRGIPDPAKPDDPGKDARTGEIMVQGLAGEFWQRAKDAGYRWVDRGFKRYWIHAPNRTLETPD